jgi:hypothetical protein
MKKEHHQPPSQSATAPQLGLLGYVSTFLLGVGGVLKGLFGFAEELILRVLGWFGGLICALAASLVMFYYMRVYHLHWLVFVGASLAFIVVFSMLGVLLNRYFACFSFPVFVILGSRDNGQYTSEPNSSREERLAWIGILILAGSVLGLAAGAVFQSQLAFYIGAAVFSTYAVAAPFVFTALRKKE